MNHCETFTQGNTAHLLKGINYISTWLNLKTVDWSGSFLIVFRRNQPADCLLWTSRPRNFIQQFLLFKLPSLFPFVIAAWKTNTMVYTCNEILSSHKKVMTFSYRLQNAQTTKASC